MRTPAGIGRTLICLVLACSLMFGAARANIGSDGGYRLLKLDGYHVKWGETLLGAGAIVSYAFVDAPTRFDGARNCSELVPMTELTSRNNISDETLRAETAAAFRAWEEAANITFVAAPDPKLADILIGAQGEPVGRAYANVMYQPGSNNGFKTIKRAMVCLNPNQRWKVGFDGNIEIYDLRYTLVHEIGHAIGLDHPSPSGQIMSFRYTEQYGNLQAGDFHGAQLLYGPGMKTMTADSSSD
jgi:hypothetical protein